MSTSANYEAFLCFVLCISSCFLIEAQKGGFTIDLIHRDSPKSPFYRPSETSFQHITNAIRSSFARANRFSKTSISTDAVQTDIISNQGSYLMKVSIGTPPFEILAVADTGSDLVWTQCQPCTSCYRQKAPLFKPKSSSSYRDISCSSRQCQALDGTGCSTEDNTCQYSVSYGDNSYSFGNLATETVTLGSTTGRPTSFPKTIFGCGHDNDGTFSEEDSGIVGLGGGAVSLISQLRDTIAGKFSYCLVPLTSESKGTSKLNFGSNAVVSGSGVITTPLVSKNPDTFYFLTLEAISVANERIDFTGSSFGTTEGNIIIDSGTTLTLLPENFYSKLESSVASKIAAKPISSPVGGLSLCYEATDDFRVPQITVHFTNADIELKPLNTFIRVSEQAVCFTFADAGDVAIYGNLSQQDFLVGYDTEKRTVSFKPSDCSKA
ncbi:hypothetical protein SLEP1_g19363 [Rubroshorea leprosula]|nr:hypothetical protein SLEP1_g19363 [Rubroshorea leprosula]